MIKTSSGNSGQALTEFVIVFPIIIYFTLILIQTALIYNAYQVVNYAAYCSGRAGIVYKGNMEKIRKAAILAAIPIAGKKLPSTSLPSSPSIDLPVIPGIIDSDYVALYLEKYYCSSLKTEVDLEESADDEITVTVTHHFQLVAPGVGVLLVPLLRILDMPLSTEAQESSEKFEAPHLPVKATCTLPM